MELVTEVTVIRPYVLRVRFDDGAEREIDVGPVLFGEVFEPLKEAEMFAKAYVDVELGTVVWPNGADLSPEFLRRGKVQPVPNRDD
jgi:hypothetical protein